MKRKALIVFVITAIFALNASGQTVEKYSRVQIVQDLEYLYKTLEESHFNLYINTSKDVFDIEFKRIKESLPDSLSLMEVYRLFQPFASLSGLGHCSLNYPFNRLYGTYIEDGGKVFPLTVLIEKDKVLIKSNFTDTDAIVRGAELISINDHPIQEIAGNIYNYLSGESDYLKNTLLDMVSFPRMMWILEETANSYDIKIRNIEGAIKNLTIESITAKEFESLLSKKEKPLFQSGRTFKFIKSIAYIRPGAFMNANASGNTSEVETFEKGEFVSFIDSAFVEIYNQKSENLIIDLRNNSGGSNTFSDEMLAYFSNKPFRFYSKFSVKSSEVTKDFWKKVDDPSLEILKNQILSHSNGQIFEVDLPYHNPRNDSLKFEGNVFVLINRYTYSQATLTAAMVQDYGFGILIGEETADVPTNYGSIHQFSLKNTKIEVSYPKALIIRPNGDTTFSGTIPEYPVNDNILSDEDEILEYALDLIKN